LRKQPPFFVGAREHSTRVLYLIYLAEPMEAGPESSHRTSRTADESTDCPADIQRNNPVG